MNGRSLAGSLGQGLSIGLVLGLVVQWVLVTSLTRQVTLSFVRSRLEHDAESLLVVLKTGPGGRPRLEGALNPTFERPFSGHYYQLRYRGHEIASRSLWQTRLPVSTTQPLLEIPGPRQQTLLVLGQVIEFEGAELQLKVAEDITPLQKALSRFQVIYSLVSALLLGLLLALQKFLIDRLLSPLRRPGEEIARLDQQEHTRLNDAVPAEIRPLVQAFNHLLNLQQERLTRSRHALGDLSHALKQPLTRIQQLLENRPWPELEAELAGITLRIEHQLARARLAGRSALMSGIELEALLSELLPALRQMYRDKDLIIELELEPGLKLRMDRQDALELLGNLLENACKWTTRHIWVRARQGQNLVLEVSDDGPGVAAELLAQLSQRGVRADQVQPGHGLGLAIVKDLAQSYGGSLQLVSQNGFLARISLPAQGPEL